MKTKRLIKKLIEKSDLSTSDKINAEILLDRAFLSEENQSLRELIDVLEKLYKDLGDKDEFNDQEYSAPRYQKALLKVIEDYKSRSRSNDYIINTEYFQPFDDYTPIAFEKFLGSLCKKGTKIEKTEDGKIVFTPDDPDILERILKHAEDDGCGYAPKGFQEVFTSYQDRGDMNIYLWT